MQHCMKIKCIGRGQFTTLFDNIYNVLVQAIMKWHGPFKIYDNMFGGGQFTILVENIT